MNQQIRQLALQADEYCRDYIANWTMIDYNKKFAELIIRECAQFVEDKFDFIGEEIIVKEKMLEHFGVEE